jgi:serine/threonine protein phosphatase 1
LILLHKPSHGQEQLRSSNEVCIALFKHLNNIKYRKGRIVVFGASVPCRPAAHLGRQTHLSKRRDTVWNSPSLQSERAAARLPDGLRIYAIGDIHGRADLLAALLRQIDVDCALYPSSRPIVVFIGDYIDRGSASREVLDLLLGCERTKETVFLKGNHETFVHRFLSEPAVLDEWRLCGGLETLVSYGLRPSINPGVAEQRRLAKELAKAIPKRHLEFLESLNPSFSCGDFLFVHAGIRPGVPIRKQREEDLLWIREEFFSCEQRCEKFVVHGHTPVPTPDFRSNRINIDTGAFATGRLTCIVIESTSIVELIDVRDCNTASIPRCSEYTDEDRACRVDLATQISPQRLKA